MNFIKKNKLLIIIIILSTGFLFAIGVTANREKIGLVENGAAAPLNFIQSGIYKASNAVKNSIGFIKNFSEIKEENDKLRTENIELKNKLSEYSELEKKYKRLQGMLNFKEQNSEFDLIGCEIIGISGGGFLNGFTINRGSNDGIEKRMVAVTDQGLVGQVTSVGSNWAKVRTLANENIAVAGYVERTSEINGIVRGYKDDNNNILAKIEIPSLESSLKPGDVIMTSGIGGIYHKGIKIGEIIDVEEDKSKVVKYGIIKPYVDITKISEMAVVVPKEKIEIVED